MKHRAHHGFSLVEVLVSVLIVSFMGMLIYESLTQASAAKEETEAALDRTTAIRVTLQKMVRDISMAFLSKHKDPAMGDKPRTIFRADRDKMAFTALSHVRLYRDADESDQCEISYWVKRGSRGRGNALWRRESRRIDDRPEVGGPSMILLEDVVKLNLRFWEGKDCTEDCWKDRWDTTQLDGQPNRLPPRVRIELTVKDELGYDAFYETEAQLQMVDPFNF
jgi:general secretion pathway protein J